MFSEVVISWMLIDLY